ncbi:MAG: CDP-alcohol phosphatidyltransferase family protein [Deltaproteobacteria bacterium]|nr:CDP-alcohol phosphatidyltransferase family protein [Deltaproteobacteria bacterium]
MKFIKIIPNILSLLRIIIAPVLLFFAWNGYKNYFLAFLILSLLSDAVDGFIARKFEISTSTGAKLDSFGDMATYLVIPLCAWWLWPEILKQEAPYVLMTICSYIFPLVAGILKFHKVPSYHTYGAKIAAVIMSIAILFLFLTELRFIFKFAAIFQVIVALEEIAITIQLPYLKSNVNLI